MIEFESSRKEVTCDVQVVVILDKMTVICSTFENKDIRTSNLSSKIELQLAHAGVKAIYIPEIEIFHIEFKSKALYLRDVKGSEAYLQTTDHVPLLTKSRKSVYHLADTSEATITAVHEFEKWIEIIRKDVDLWVEKK